MQFVIDETRTGQYSLNKIYAGKHWSARKKDAEYWHKLTQYALMAAGVPKLPKDGPWAVTVLYNDRLDIDNHGFITKCVIDGLKGWVIPDDTRKYLKTVTQGFWSGSGVMVIVELAAAPVG